MASAGGAAGGGRDLGRLLAEAGSPLTEEDARAVAAGAAAAPPGRDPRAWLDLVAGRRTPELEEALLALKDALGRPPPAPDPAGRLAALRAELIRRRLDGFVVPYADETLGEFVPARARRLAWLTGFTGSAGVAVVLADAAAVFVDGRYTLQVRDQVPGDLFEHRDLLSDPHAEWAARLLPEKGVLGFDPRLHTVTWLERTRAVLQRAGAALAAVEDNPVDAVWTDQPAAPISPMVPHDLRFAGRSAADKRAELGRALTAEGCACAVLTQPESVAWLLNVRGGDVPCTPLSIATAILRADGTADLFVDGRKLAPGTLEHLGNGVAVHPPDGFGPALDALGSVDGRVRVDPQTANAWVFERLHRAGARIDRGEDPVALPRACKNAAELDGARAAHRRDAVAMARMLHWIATVGPAGRADELEAAARLQALRAEAPEYRGDSFDAIAGSGPNGAIVHYRATEATSRRLEPGTLFLLDSGAQYPDGTTDVTRTWAVGEPTAEMRRHATLVLKGHVAVATAVFPQGTTGSQIDAFARRPLWEAGLDFDHGTGHGVGSFLGVHEGPQRIAKVPNTVALRPGMIVSNEPGYYRAGAYGIRLENLVAVVPREGIPGAERPMLGFETLTLAPFDRALIDPALLTADEREWVDAYHARVRDALAGRLPADAAAWLEAATAPL
jgi:Xaa-Pro aminopeptidase